MTFDQFCLQILIAQGDAEIKNHLKIPDFTMRFLKT